MNKELNVVKDWTDIPKTFRTMYYECGKEILPGRAFWSDLEKVSSEEIIMISIILLKFWKIPSNQ